MITKLLQGFKKLAFFVFIASALAAGFIACTNEDDPPTPTTYVALSQFFSIPNATLVQGAIPSTANGASIGDVIINSTAIPGGSSNVTINSLNDIQKLYVSIKGSNQYYTITPSATKSTVFDFVILLSQALNRSFEIQISALLADGSTSALYSSSVTYYPTGTGGTGGLQVSLSFNNEKDVDLYVIQPDGDIIFYGNKGATIYDSITGQYVYWWGLDLDSNPACNIDSINNENVFYPDTLVQTGTYQVWINMYSNCDNTIPTTCVVTANHASQLITNLTYGVNPSTHIFPIGEPSNSIGSDTTGAVKIMEFNMVGTPAGPKKAYNSKLTESAKMKLNSAIRRR
ncbi:MAG: hypothetical protein WCQ30_02260 [Bacteroidales bacterium]